MKFICKPFISVFVLAGLLSGCGSGSGQANIGKKCDGTVAPKKIVSADRLPSVDDYLPLMDNGRIEIAPPQGWEVKGGTRTYLKRFYKEGSSEIPWITIVAGNSPFYEIESVNENNLDQFAHLIAEALKDNQTRIIERVRPMIIGNRPWVRYVRFGLSDTNLEIETQLLKTQFEGRIYTIELLIPPGEILESRDFAYAVAAGVNFIPRESEVDP